VWKPTYRQARLADLRQHPPAHRHGYEDLRATGRAMAEMLLRRIDGEPPETLNVLFEPERCG
jgi:DNA-binding LacI/PurR family transcriptional regulator